MRDGEKTYQALVDKLLASPRFGERWGRHWLDVARYAESVGKERNSPYRMAWRYRDYVIDAFNADKPFDEFIREQIAGDLLPARTAAERDEHLIATGFQAVGPKALSEPNVEQFYFDIADEQVDTTCRAFLATTAGCARCHDHKFDPIPTADYYALIGIFRNPSTLFGGAQNYGSAFLPASFQGTRIGGAGETLAQAKVAHISTTRVSTAEQRRWLDLIQSMNRRRLEADVANNELEGVIESYELAFRMQGAMPRLMDLGGETQTTLEKYGIGSGRPTDEFGRACLLARRFAEAGVRFIEVSHSDWDQHSDLKKLHTEHARAVDRPIAALLADLDERGLLEETLVVWGGEFGRTPAAAVRAGDGRDHNATGYTMWLAGGGVKGGLKYGATDEHGVHAVENKTHIHDLHATILHLLGLDHTKLTYKYSGRDFRLTDVHGRVLSEIIS